MRDLFNHFVLLILLIAVLKIEVEMFVLFQDCLGINNRREATASQFGTRGRQVMLVILLSLMETVKQLCFYFWYFLFP